MRRKLLLIEPATEDQRWITTKLGERFRYMQVTTVPSIQQAHDELLRESYDFIITDLMAEPERPADVVYKLVELVPTVPIIVVTEMPIVGEYLLDVISIGVKHILYKADLRQDISKLVSALIETVYDLSRRDAIRDAFGERMQAVTHKIHSIDGHITRIENAIESVANSMVTLMETIEKRGGLEDRVKELENNKATAVKVGLWAAGVMGSIIVGILGVIAAYLKK